MGRYLSSVARQNLKTSSLSSSSQHLDNMSTTSPSPSPSPLHPPPPPFTPQAPRGTRRTPRPAPNVLNTRPSCSIRCISTSQHPANTNTMDRTAKATGGVGPGERGQRLGGWGFRAVCGLAFAEWCSLVYSIRTETRRGRVVQEASACEASRRSCRCASQPCCVGPESSGACSHPSGVVWDCCRSLSRDCQCVNATALRPPRSSNHERRDGVGVGAPSVCDGEDSSVVHQMRSEARGEGGLSLYLATVPAAFQKIPWPRRSPLACTLRSKLMSCGWLWICGTRETHGARGPQPPGGPHGRHGPWGVEERGGHNSMLMRLQAIH